MEMMEVLTVDEFINHLTALKEHGSISGTDIVVDTGIFPITHVVRYAEGKAPYITLESDMIDIAADELELTTL